MQILMKTNFAAGSPIEFGNETNILYPKRVQGPKNTMKTYAPLISTIEGSQGAHLLCFSKWPPGAIFDSTNFFECLFLLYIILKR